MTKLIVAAVLATVAYGVVRWRQEPVVAAHRHLAFNRIWIDHLPTGEKDPFHVFAAFPDFAQGGFAVETRWHGEVERFRFERDGEALRAIFPWSGDREHIVLHAYRCEENDMDFCLEMKGSKRGAKKYYSRTGWERRSVEDVEAFKSTLFR